MPAEVGAGTKQYCVEGSLKMEMGVEGGRKPAVVFFCRAGGEPGIRHGGAEEEVKICSQPTCFPAQCVACDFPGSAFWSWGVGPTKELGEGS